MPSKFAPNFYEPDKDGNYVFGANCHQQHNAAFPVWCITDLEDNILISNAPDLKSGRPWVLLKARTNINRYWQASTAYFQCTLAALDVTEDIPPAPNGLYRHPVTSDSLISKTTLGVSTAAPEQLQTQFQEATQGQNKTELKGKIDQIIKDFDSAPEPTLGEDPSLWAETLAAYEKQFDQKIQQQGLPADFIKQQIGAGNILTPINKKNPSFKTVLESYSKFLASADGTVEGARTPEQLDAEIRQQPLYILDEICIYAGYLDTMRPVSKQDIGDNRLLRRGVWSVDTVTYSGSPSTGVIWTVQCRDRLKYLMDTFGSYNTAEGDEFFLKSGGNDTLGGANTARSQVILSLSRRAIGDMGTQNISIGGRRIKQGYIYDIESFGNSAGTADQTDANTVIDFDPYLPYIGEVYVQGKDLTAAKLSSDDTEAQLRPIDGGVVFTVLNMKDEEISNLTGRQGAEFRALSRDKGSIPFGEKSTVTASGTTSTQERTTNALQYVGSLRGSVVNVPVSKEMKFNIVTGRVSYSTNASQYFGQNFIVADRVPLDYIRFLSQQEAWPTEVFQDHRTGEYWYVVRGLDVTGLYDPQRFNRTYFFRQYPEDLRVLNTKSNYVTHDKHSLDLKLEFPHAYPHSATMLTSFREEASAVSMRTNIIVQTHASGGTQPTKILHLAVEPPFLKDRAYPCSFFTITDDTADAVPGTMVAVGLAYARVIGKEVRAAAATMLGDPSLTPGEAIQVVGSPMHQGTTEPNFLAEQREKFLDMSLDYIKFYSNMPNVAKQNPTKTDSMDVVIGKGSSLNKIINTNGSGETITVTKFANTDALQPTDRARGADKRPNTISFNPEPVTMWRVDGVVDKFNDGVLGYYTEVSLLSCF